MGQIDHSVAYPGLEILFGPPPRHAMRIKGHRCYYVIDGQEAISPSLGISVSFFF